MTLPLAHYDAVRLPCPRCADEVLMRSTSGKCDLSIYDLKDCPMDVLAGLAGADPVVCPCGASLAVDFTLQASVKEQGYSPCN